MLCRQAALGQKKEGAGDWDSSGVKADSPDIVRDTAAAIRKRGKYLQAQLRVDEGTECYLTPIVKALLAICKCYKGRESGWIDADNVTEVLGLQEPCMYDSEGRATVQVLYQHNGDMVHVPNGWPHQLLNLKPCVKLAWDYYDPVNMARYALSWLYIRGKYMPRSDDYTGAAVDLKNASVSVYPKLKL